MLRTQGFFKILSTTLATLFIVASILLSAHAHADFKFEKKENNCSLCQISQNFTKYIQTVSSSKIAPQRSFERLGYLNLQKNSSEEHISLSIRGPPSTFFL